MLSTEKPEPLAAHDLIRIRMKVSPDLPKNLGRPRYNFQKCKVRATSKISEYHVLIVTDVDMRLLF